VAALVLPSTRSSGEADDIAFCQVVTMLLTLLVLLALFQHPLQLHCSGIRCDLAFTKTN